MRFLKDSALWWEKSPNTRMDVALLSDDSVDFERITLCQDDRCLWLLHAVVWIMWSLTSHPLDVVKYLGKYDLNGYLLCLYCDSIVVMKMEQCSPFDKGKGMAQTSKVAARKKQNLDQQIDIKIEAPRTITLRV